MALSRCVLSPMAVRRVLFAFALLASGGADARAAGPGDLDAAPDAAMGGDGSATDAGTPGVDDDVWERGATALPAPRPRAAQRACSFVRAVCVWGPAGAEREIATALGTLEEALARVTGALRLPAPDADPTTGAFDVYLVETEDDDVQVRFAGRDVFSSYDRGHAFVELPRVLRGCARERAIHHAVVRGALMRAAPSATTGVTLAAATHLARLANPCAAPSDLDDIAAFQGAPTRTLFDAGNPPERGDLRFARGASAFFDWADTRFGAEPGGLVRASYALMATHTPLGSDTFAYRPDLFDVWRTSFKEALSIGSSIDDLFLRFTGARASFGANADNATLLASRQWGDAANVRTDFAVDWPEKPRRFLSPRPVAPTGASYMVVRRQGAKPGARLRIEAEWEEHSRFRFMALKRAPGGAITSTVLVPATTRAVNAQATITELDGVDAVIIVGMNAGDHERPFDPDEPTWEPHAFLLTIASE